MLKIQTNNRCPRPAHAFQGSLLVGLMTVLLPVLPAQANDYQTCTAKLKAAKVADDVVAKVCAEALHPKIVGLCVERIVAKKLDADPTVEACRRVRRPIELAKCVTEIAAQDVKAPMPEVLDSCRRSLLPDRFGECVVGLNRQPLKVATKEGLGICIDASDRPKDLQLIPLDQVITPSGSIPTSPSLPAPRTDMPKPTPAPVTTPQLF
ncbi:MAG: hypothetical protein VKJ24_13820 [Synechococcales bacterium]|nr:hypothetical protein [Synechococcales bacterium]